GKPPVNGHRFCFSAAISSEKADRFCSRLSPNILPTAPTSTSLHNPRFPGGAASSFTAISPRSQRRGWIVGSKPTYLYSHPPSKHLGSSCLKPLHLECQ